MSFHWLYQLFTLYRSRKDEMDADMYACDSGYGRPLRMALIRNFAANLDNIFCSPLDTFFGMSHPTLL